MKSLTFLASAFAATPLIAAVPVIDTSSVSVGQGPGKTVVIEYTMNPASPGDTEPAIVTVDILTNAVGGVATSVGGEHLTTLSGDVNKVVPHTANFKHNILWEPTKEGFPEFKLPAEQVTAKITLWSTNAPPNYWVIDLTQRTDRTADHYYPEVGQIPLGVTNIIYKTDRLVFRRIPAKGVTWKQGDPTVVANSYNTCRYVTFTYDYFMSIYEVTCTQHNRIQSSYPVAESAKPMTQNLTNWRGDPDSGDYAWPDKGHGSVKTYLNAYRNGLGGIKVDLPTSAEWEFACRAGSATKYCNGDTVDDLNKVAWTYSNSGGAMKEVGTKEPNDWGMYDMHGNAFEWTLTRFATRTSDPEWDPVGPKSSEVNTTAGSPPPYCNRNYAWRIMGGRCDNPTYGTASYCTSFGTKDVHKTEMNGGARLVVPLQ